LALSQDDGCRNIAIPLIDLGCGGFECTLLTTVTTARAEIVMQDLSFHHRPVTSLFLATDQPAAARHALDEKRDLFYEYNSNESGDPNQVLFHALGAWRIAAGFHDLLWHPAFTIPAAQLLGGAVRFWHDQLFCKPAHHGGVVAWHQDYSYWTRTQPLAHLTCWIGLDDSTRENGCLQYIERSHRWPDLPITGLAGDMDAISAVLDDQQRREFEHPVAAELKKGEASFHHSRIVHGSFANHSERSRRATVINVVKDGVRSASNEPLLQGVPVIPPGQKIEGQFFPLLSENRHQ
jgi:hypothetical protein